MHRPTNMSTRVKKTELLAILEKNRDGHKAIFEEALEGYKKEMIRLLLRMLKDIRAGKKVHHMISLPQPSNMTASYNTVIKMLKMNQDETIELSAEDFACFVEDKWEWRHNFLHSNSGYSNTAQILSAQMSDEE